MSGEKGFRKLRGINLPYDKQGEIFFICRNYKGQNRRTRDKIDRLCRQCGRDNWRALFDLLTKDESTYSICMRYLIASPTTLYRARKQFYELW